MRSRIETGRLLRQGAVPVKRTLLIAAGALSLAALMVLIAVFVPASLPAHSDFSALYNTDLALVHRVPIYDLERVEALAARQAGIPEEHFFLARFPYPPWYALSTFYLGWLPARAAATLWFEINLVMLFASVWLLTEGWPPRRRLAAFPLALFFFPVLGALSVGQYDFPVLLGVSLLIHALRREAVPQTVAGLVLLTFKPHVGLLALLTVLVWAFLWRREFGQRLVRPLLGAALILVFTGFLADPGWIAAYPQMLLTYRGEGNVAACSECASLPVYLSRLLFDGSLAAAALLAVALLLLFLTGLYAVRSSLRSPALILSAALLITLLVSPYLYNYDFLLLLVPLAVVFSGAGRREAILAGLCHLVPTLALLFLGRDGNPSLILASLVLLVLLWMRMKNPGIDFTGRAAYNSSH